MDAYLHLSIWLVAANMVSILNKEAHQLSWGGSNEAGRVRLFLQEAGQGVDAQTRPQCLLLTMDYIRLTIQLHYRKNLEGHLSRLLDKGMLQIVHSLEQERRVCDIACLSKKCRLENFALGRQAHDTCSSTALARRSNAMKASISFSNQVCSS